MCVTLHIIRAPLRVSKSIIQAFRLATTLISETLCNDARDPPYLHLPLVIAQQPPRDPHISIMIPNHRSILLTLSFRLRLGMFIQQRRPSLLLLKSPRISCLIDSFRMKGTRGMPFDSLEDLPITPPLPSDDRLVFRSPLTRFGRLIPLDTRHFIGYSLGLLGGGLGPH